jgi:hypothetical protein
MGGPARVLPPGTSERVAAGAFVAFEAAALVWLIGLGRSQWFIADEWDFLADRTAFDLHDLVRPHNEHLSTLPILAFRGLWALVGVRSYLPYLALVVVLHLTVAALLRAVMRREGVGPWWSSLTASLLVLFGAGAFNIEYAFQVGFVGALVFGLLGLLVTDRDGSLHRDDALGLACAIAAILCSGVGVAMVTVIAFSTLVRRGWRVAAFHAGIPALLYVTWWTTLGRSAYRRYIATPGEALSFVWANLRSPFHSIGPLPGFDIALAAMFVAGLGLAWRTTGSERARTHLNMVAGLLAGAMCFLTATAIGRGHVANAIGTFVPRQDEPRYVYVVAALALPGLALAASEITRRWRWLTPAVVVLIVAGIPGNVDDLVETTRGTERLERAIRHEMLAIPHLPEVRRMPRSIRPNRPFAQDLTLGWLLDAFDSGKLPAARRASPVDAARLTVSLVVRPAPARGLSECTPLLTAQVVRLPRRGSIGFTGGPVVVVYTTDGGVRSTPATYSPRFGARTLALTTAIPIEIEVAPATARPSTSVAHVGVCRRVETRHQGDGR